jgi:tetratricopeptide (TPR) repeat protein
MKNVLEPILIDLDKIILLPSQQQEGGLKECLNKLHALPMSTRNSDYYYLEGYAYYLLHPSSLPEAEFCFKKALELDGLNNYARLYLGHCLYDRKDYQLAVDQFLKVDKNYLPDFLKMKVDEMIICCELRCSSSKKKDLLQDFFQQYQPQNYFDDYPFELSKLLKTIGSDIREEESIALQEQSSS